MTPLVKSNLHSMTVRTLRWQSILPALRCLFTCQLAAFGLLLVSGAQASKLSKDELAAISRRGTLLAEYDSAAWQATDAVKAAHPVDGRMGRYIARKTDAGWAVDFGRLNDTGDKFLLAYEADQRGGTGQFEVRKFDPVREDAGWNLAAARGIDIAMKDLGRTGRPYNVAVLPAEHEGMYVYLYPAQIEAGVYPLGADVRYRVSPDGTEIIEKRQMHQDIIEYAPARKDVKVTVGYHTHVLSDLPEDTDVLLVLTRKPQVPELVLAGPYMFTIHKNGQISVEDRPR